MAAFDFLAETPAGLTDSAPTFNPAAAPAPGGFAQAFSDPNVLRALSQLGSGISQGQPIGQAVGGASDVLARNRALQAAAAAGSERQQSFMDQLIRALKGDPTGRGLLGPKEDMGTLDSITMTNDGISIKAPNKDRTRPFEQITDQPLEAQPRSLAEPERLGEGAEAFPFL